MKLLKYTFFTIVILIMCYFSSTIGYKIYSPSNDNFYVDTETPENIIKESIEKEVNSQNKNVINENTKIVYEYYYKEDDYTEYIEDTPSYFLIGLTREQLENKLKDWQIKSFSEEEVVMQKIIQNAKTLKYIITEYEGYVAVFYIDNQNTKILKYITKTPILSLSEEEQKNIKNGIEIEGEEKLISILQDYES